MRKDSVRFEEWRSVAAATATVLLSLGLAGWVLERGSSPTPETGQASVLTPPRSADVAAVTGDPKALFVARRAGDVLVGLAVRPGGPIEVTAITSAMKPLPLAAVRARIDARPLRASSCGPNCFRFGASALGARAVVFTVEVVRKRKPSARATVRLPARIPPAADPLLRAASRRMSQLRTLRADESLSSGGPGIRTLWSFRAPDRVSYRISTGAKAFLIGKRRWDWENGEWRVSDYDPVRVPTLLWRGARSARLLGSTRLGGERVRVLAAFRPDRDFPAWFRLYVAADRRVLRAEMLAPAHFMVDRYRDFNAPFTIVPPR